ncbi:DUF3761 domain-containing protein [Kitasatospora sp. NPDC008050]|uniref:DUF3761 domain-containing protein n=1 Tax=Kitasatospora sp. NPDC008050 TaxID=3364021 RepID=UPI0036E61FF1
MGNWTKGSRGAGGWIVAGAVAAVLLTAGCDPNATDSAKAQPAATSTTQAPAPASSAPVPAPAPTSASPVAPTTHAPSQQPTHPPTAKPTTAKPPTPAAEPTKPAEPTRPAAEPTSPAPAQAPAGSCASHSVGDCGWDLGLTPAHSGETAECADGSTSDSAHFQGTCSQHRGVRHWFK